MRCVLSYLDHWAGKYVRVGNGERYEECGDFPNEDYLFQSNVTCVHPIIGQNVTINPRETSNDDNLIRLILCEGMIFGYKFEGKKMGYSTRNTIWTWIF